MSNNLDVVRRTGSAPRVNLLPSEIGERRARSRQRGLFVVLGVALLAVLGLWYATVSMQAADAKRQAANREAEAVRLEGEKSGLQQWADLQSQVVALEQLRASVYANEVRMSGVLQDISMIVPDNVWLTQMSVTVKDAPGSSAGKPAANPQASVPGAPGSGTTVASITFSGKALSHVDVGKFVRMLDSTIKKNGLAVYGNPYFTSSQKDSTTSTPTVTFAATVDLEPAAVSGRFQNPETTTGGS